MTRRGRRSRTGITGSGWATSSEPNQGDMMVDATKQRRFRLSIRSLMIAVAVSAVALVPFLWVARQTALLRAQAMRALDAERRARAEAERSRYVALVHAAQAQFGAKAADPSVRPDDASTAG